MSLETKETTTNAIVIRAKGTNLYFCPREFVVVTDLNCVLNKDDFVFDEDLPNRLIDDYFGGAKYIQKRELFAAFSGKIWGKDNDEDAVKFVNLYFIHAFLLSAIDTVVIPRLHFDLDGQSNSSSFELETNAPRPRYESLMESMFNEANVKVSFKNIEPTRKEISCFWILKKVVPAGVSHKDDEKKLKQQHKGLDEQTPKRTPPSLAAKKLSVRTPIFMSIQQKEKVASKKKDINRSARKKSIPIESPDSSLCRSGDEDNFISKKVFHNFCNEVLQEMKSIHGLVSTRCDAIMNAISEIKKKDKDNQVNNPPMGEAIETTPHHEFSLNFVHDLYKNSKDTLVTKEINGNQNASLMELYNEDKDDVLNTGGAAETTVNTSTEDESKDNECDAEKILNLLEFNMDNSKLNQQNQSPIHIHVALTEERKAEQNFSDSQVTIPDELLPSLNPNLNQERSIIHIDVCFYYQRKKSKYDPNTSYKYSTIDCNFMNIINSVLVVYRIDDDSLNVGGKEYHLNEYINGFRMHATVPWHTVDHISISINVKVKHHWVLAVISFNDRCIYVYDSLSSAGHDVGVLAEVEKFAEDLPQQPSGSLDCGLYMVTYAEYLTFGDLVSPVDFDPDMIRTRYASILWNYGMKKEEENAQSDDEAPMRPPREIGLTEDTEIHEI
ncbi:hypothetical protein BC332_15438 [Capsicum chinense]|nr:hypothetical protein BC332_15438 [Capsicum chinense]